MESFAIVVVLYYPDDESVANLKKLAKANQLLIVVDNSSPSVISGLAESKNTIVIRNNKNIGLASALNQGIEYAGHKGIENIFLLDQDTRLPNGYCEKMLLFKGKAEKKAERYALYVPNFYDRNSKTYAKFPVFQKYRFQHYCCGTPDAAFHGKAVIAITSGSLISYTKFKQIGPMPEEYFIDFIDNEYCLRAFLKGFRVAVNCGLTINHSIGQRIKKRILMLTFKPNHHPPIRRYYISRNGIATAIRYFAHFKSYPFLLFLRLIHEYLSIILFEKNKSLKLYASFSGLLDGMMSKLGPCSRKF
jgi:rhamnosyltransferase